MFPVSTLSSTVAHVNSYFSVSVSGVNTGSNTATTISCSELQVQMSFHIHHLIFQTTKSLIRSLLQFLHRRVIVVTVIHNVDYALQLFSLYHSVEYWVIRKQLFA